MTKALLRIRLLATGVVHEMITRRLWPIAVLLLIAVVATPVLIGKDPEAPPVATAAATNAVDPDPLGGVPLVAASDDPQVDRRLLGVRKDPFKPSGDQKSRTPADGPDTAGPTAGADGSGGPSAGGSTSGASAPDSSPPSSPGSAPGPESPAPESPAPESPGPGAPAPEAPTPDSAPPAKNLDLYSMTVAIDGVKRQAPLKRLDPLLSKEVPAIIYLGLLEDGQTAVFLLDEGVTADGDGSCHPSPADCQLVHLGKGETEFFTRAAPADGATEPAAVDFQLDVLDIETKKSSSAAAARAARAAASTAGRRILRARIGRMGRLRYDRRTGRLHELSRKAYAASMALASRRRAHTPGGFTARASGRHEGLGEVPSARAAGRRAGLATP